MALIIDDECINCDVCEPECPNGAISINIKDPKYINELIAKIESVVDVEAQPPGLNSEV